MNEDREKASSSVHTYGTDFERPGSGVGSGRLNDPDLRTSFKGLWDQLPPSEFLPCIHTSAKRNSYSGPIIPIKIILSLPLYFL